MEKEPQFSGVIRKPSETNDQNNGKAAGKISISIPEITLPKGGGAIKSIDEKFQVNAANGTAGFSIPFPFSPSRNSFMPALALNYNSGSGNGIFGLGWNAEPASITRKTEKKLPEYNDADESDTFIFSGTEDLVPALQNVDGNWIKDEDGLAKRYRPRIEGGFARIEKITEANGNVYWKVTSKDNILSFFGKSKSAQIFDPENPSKIFKWLFEFSCDDKGSCYQYEYKAENKISIPNSLFEKNRLNDFSQFTNTYLKRIKYCNQAHFYRDSIDYSDWDSFLSSIQYLLELVVDYGEHDVTNPQPSDNNDWHCRKDPFSDYRAGFEIRTYRLCQRLLMFHHFDELGSQPCLVRSVNFEYGSGTAFTFLKSVTKKGFIRKADNAYSEKSLPPVEFTYEPLGWNTDVKTLPRESLENLPVGIDDHAYQWIDLFGEGLSGILTEQANAWYYKRNSGNGNFDPAKLVSPKPSFTGLSVGAVHFQDVEANGQKFLVSNDLNGYYEFTPEEEWLPFKNFNTIPNIDLRDPNLKMLDLNGDGKADILISEDDIFVWYASKGKEGFESYRTSRKTFDEEKGAAIVFADSTQSIVLSDMSGDGLMDIVRIRNRDIVYWPNLGYGKFGAKVSMSNAPLFDNPDHFNPKYVKLADLDGSGVTDIVYLGKDLFKIYFNQSGNSWSEENIVYGIDPIPFSKIDDHSNINIVDLLGNGTGCIVWSSPLPAYSSNPLRYIDLMNGKKPHIMTSYKNNMGKEVYMHYKPSTSFYLEDKKADSPWITKLPFPVQCVSEVEVIDQISKARFTNQYAYHHGYYDYKEREFRGFGRVDQTDTENFDNYRKHTNPDGSIQSVDEPLYQPPVLTKSWFHTGAFLGSEKILNQFEHEHWFEELRQFEELNQTGYTVIDHEHILPAAKIIDEHGNDIDIRELTSIDWREALRACKGMVLRTEVFAKDPIDQSLDEQRKQLTPYSVATHNCIIQRLQPRGQNQHAIFIAKESEAITYSYERSLYTLEDGKAWEADPKIAHNLNTRFGEYANVLEAASIAYPRRIPYTALPQVTQDAQNITYITYVENTFTNDILEEDAYRLRLPAEVKTWQLKGVNKIGDYFSLIDFRDILNNSDTALYHEINAMPVLVAEPVLQPFYKSPVYKPLKRLIEHARAIYRSDNLVDQLPLREIASLGIPFENYQLAYIPELLHDIYHEKLTGVDLEKLMSDGNFVHSEGDLNWWIQSGQMNFIDAADHNADTPDKAQARFYLPISYTDPYSSVTKVEYETHKLFVQKTTDALLNESTVTHFNYRTLSPQRMKDMNDNLSEAVTDELGLVKAMAVMGKDTDHDEIGEEADDLSSLKEETTDQTDIDNFFSIADAAGVCDSVNLRTKANDLLQHATVRFIYNFDAYKSNNGKPAVVASIVREEHYQKNNHSPIQLSFEYSNGLGKVIMKKVQAEPGKAKQVTIGINNIATVVDPIPNTSPFLRWVGNGRTILNNKGNPVKQYEPFFSVSPKFEDEKELVETGVTPIMYYDALGRLIKTEMPDGSFSKVRFATWTQTVFDANDTVQDSDWYKRRTESSKSDYINDINEQNVAEKVLKHYYTPSQIFSDAMGRSILSVEHNTSFTSDVNEFHNMLFSTKMIIDIEGNLRSVIDARDNIVMEYKYDMLGNKVYQKSMDAGQRWLMLNIAGNSLRTWDERDHEFQYEYDKLHRPIQSIVINKVGQHGDKILNNIFNKIIYGESLVFPDRNNEADIKSKNLLGKPIRHYDTGGLLETGEYDFKGQPLSTKRKLFTHYKEVVNWRVDNNTQSDLETDEFIFITETDALGRITKQIAPDGSIITPSYNEAGLLNSEIVTHSNPRDLINPTTATTYIKDIDYNEKGQRNKIIYGNDVTTKFEYDKETFRLKRLQTQALVSSPEGGLQDLNYTYDPVGNILRIEDKANDTTFFKNMKVEPVSEYIYDALYRLTEAKGRENDTALDFATNDNWNDIPKMKQHKPGDPMAVVAYTESYKYDTVGNITEMNHQGSWTRINEYETNSNRLKNSKVGGQTFVYTHHNEHGYITKLPHLNEMGWNFKEELVSTSQQAVNPLSGSTPETTYYQYDGHGQRIRKITENYSPTGITTRKDERIYIAGYETYREYKNGIINAKNFERESLSLMDREHRFVMIETVKQNDTPTPSPSERVGVRLTRYQLHNHLGSACLEINEDAKVISYEEYHPYGTTAYQAKNATIKCAAKRYRYTGMEKDEETGLEYHSARYYLPWLGRWLSADPIGIGDGVNIYLYVTNNPIIGSDNNGLETYRDVAMKEWGAAIRFVGIDMGEKKMEQGLIDDDHAAELLSQGRQENAKGVTAVAEIAEETASTALLAQPAPEAEADALSTSFIEGISNKVGNMFEKVSEELNAVKNWTKNLLKASSKESTVVEKGAEKPDVLYRMMSFSEADKTLSKQSLQPSSKDTQSWVSADAFYSYNFPPKVGHGDYDVVVKFETKSGTVASLQQGGMSKMERGTENFGIYKGAALDDFNNSVTKVDLYSAQGSQSKYVSPSGDKVIIKHKGYTSAVNGNKGYRGAITQTRLDAQGKKVDTRGLQIPRKK